MWFVCTFVCCDVQIWSRESADEKTREEMGGGGLQTWMDGWHEASGISGRLMMRDVWRDVMMR